jgi:hypothetical protein
MSGLGWPMDYETAQDWLDRYVDAPTIRMTSQGCSVRTLRIATTRMTSRSIGRDAVVASWLGEIASGDASTRDAPGTYYGRVLSGRGRR